ncbi:MAG: pilin [Candidatus Colwellbacteria bacterium]
MRFSTIHYRRFIKALLPIIVILTLGGQSVVLVEAITVPELFSEGDGIFLCPELDAASCVRISNNFNDELGGKLRALVFRGNVEITIYDDNNRTNALTIDIENTREGSVPTCSYETYFMGTAGETKWSERIPCGGNLLSYSSGSQRAYYLDFNKLCHLASTPAPAQNDSQCIRKWNNTPRNFSIRATVTDDVLEVPVGPDPEPPTGIPGFNANTFFSTRDGLYACEGTAASTCQAITRGDRYSNLGSNADRYEIIAFNEPVQLTLYEETSYEGPFIQINYDGQNPPVCTYQYYIESQIGEGGSINIGPREVSEPRPCREGKRGEIPLGSYSVNGKAAYVLALENLCVEDSRVNPPDPGEVCALDWGGKISSLKEGDLSGSEQGSQGPVSLGLAHAVYNLYNWALGIGSLLALAIIIYGGVLYSASAGNPSRIEEAKKWITSALFGLALLFSTVIILNVVNPRLTTLEDIQTTINPDTNVGFNIIGGGGGEGGEDAACRAKALEDVNAHSNCDAFYLADSADFNLIPGDNMLARAGNFGDPYCHRKNLGLSGYKEQVQNVLVQELRNQGFCEAEVIHLTTIMMNFVIPREATNFNPNAVRLRGDPGEEVPQCTGAWGLFQMGKSGNPEGGADDNGDVQWAQQVHFAVRRLALQNGERYWATWPPGVEKRVSCGGPDLPSPNPNPDPSRSIL